MRYTKPMIVSTFHGNSAIQSVDLPPALKNPLDNPDNDPQAINCTSGAYEADE